MIGPSTGATTSGAAVFDGAVLCGGASRRMGEDKSLLEIDGVAMAARVAQTLSEAGAVTVATVGGDASRLRSLGLAYHEDRWPGDGPLGGVVTALGAVGTAEVVVVLGCDLVQPDAGTIAWLADRVRTTGADATVPRIAGRAQWLHVAWHRRVAGVLEDVFASGERSVFAAVTGLEIDFVEVDHSAPFADADVRSDLPSAHPD